MKRPLPKRSVLANGVLSNHGGDNAPVVFGTGLIALDIILSAYPDRAPALAAGGTCGNVLSVLSYLGWEAFPIARFNSDVASEIVTSDLERCGVDLEFARQTPAAPTPIILQRNGRTRDGRPKHQFSVACPACGAWYPSFRAVTIEGAEGVIEAVGDASNGGFRPRVFFFDRVSRGTLLLADWFADLGSLVVFEPIGVGDPKLFSEALALSHVVKYSNERLDESAVAVPRPNQLLLEIQTLGEAGLRYRFARATRKTWVSLTAVPSTRVMDTAGAGDWLTAALLNVVARTGYEGAATLTSSDIQEALRVGQAAASIACGYEGARGAMSSLNSVDFDCRTSSLLRGDARSKSRTLEVPEPTTPRSPNDLLARHKSTAPMNLGTICPTCPS